MKGSNIRRWGAALAVVIIAGAAYWFWHDRGTSGSGAPAAGQGPQGPGGARHG
ncbi:multidrug transporter subunit MdtA, partial [Klebsiella pneumoniae]|nr:multidrug transporter subunit MdtA [Klebsiella pneumoniae]MBD7542832.1 multidrug transporter subunit MdtA [Klebsiella pneumoniae]MBD7686601.1 multidrug transporter subunit MdtA [Klebsiella pneumoniae]MBK6129245.1 multidrug transporter subunit MdtA [Klebsiella pneumoniae]MBK6201931.1 multidrug transporter subunit MdtA [Klebsiella pneumoniae]